MKDLLKRMEYQINILPSGELRNLLCDINIVILNDHPQVDHSKPVRVLGDYDVWYLPCKRCGYDTGKSETPKVGNKTCWKCGEFIRRDYTDRALKTK